MFPTLDAPPGTLDFFPAFGVFLCFTLSEHVRANFTHDFRQTYTGIDFLFHVLHLKTLSRYC